MDEQAQIIDTLVPKQETLTNEIQKQEKQYENLNVRIAQMKNKLQDASEKPIKDMTKGISKVIKSMGRWALAIFGIRSLYYGLRSLINTISEYNTELADKIKSIKTTIAFALEPVITKIVDLIYRLFQYLGYLIKVWTGKDIFASAAKNLKSGAKSAKEMKNSLASFDRVNKLSGNNDSNPSGASTVSALPKGEIPKWVEWLGKNGKLLLAILAGLAAKLLHIKFGVEGIKSLGVGIAVTGFLMSIKELYEYFKKLDPALANNGTSLKEFGKIIEWVGVGILGVAIAVGSWPVAIAAAIVLVVGILIKYWDKIKEGLEKARDWVYGLGDKFQNWFINNIDKIYDKFGWLGVAIVGAVSAAFTMVTSIVGGTINTIITLFDGLFTSIKQIFDGILLIFKGNFKEGFISIGKGIINVLITAINTLIDALNSVWTGLLKIADGAGKIIGKDWGLSKKLSIPKIPLLASGGIVDIPKRGVNIGGAIAGEAGKEGVLPLTNSETMKELGQEIGKWITLNIDLTNSIDGRVLNKRLEQLRNNNSFARNGG